MSAKHRRNLRLWFYGLIGGTIGGAATAGSSWLGIAAAKAAGADVSMLDLTSLGIIMLSGGLVSLLAFLKSSPLPPFNGDEEDEGNPS